jgi:eukaryotic-like serine/threonine-protein kinase
MPPSDPTSGDSRASGSSWQLNLSELDVINTRVPLGGTSTAVPIEAPKSVLRRIAASEANEDPVEDRYAVRQEIGRGGMGRVLLVHDQDLNRDVAMKVLLGKEAADAHVRRFIEEAQITGQLEHPNVLPVHDFGVNGEGEVFFTMKFVKGHVTLEDIIERLRNDDPAAHRAFTFERRVQIMQQVCHALRYAHQRGVIHRDIKPSNIVLGPCGEVFLVDWGVAKLAADVKAAAQKAGAPLPDAPPPDDPIRKSDRIRATTREGEWLGTPAYMAPEQALAHQHEVDSVSDLYSLCAVMYELLSLHYYLGVVGGRMGDLVAAILQRRPIDAEDHKHPLNGRVPRILSRICRKGLEKRRELRYRTAQELEEALQGWLEGNTPVVCPGTAIKRGLTKWGTLIDKYPVLAPAVSITVSILLIAWIAVSVMLLTRS